MTVKEHYDNNLAYFYSWMAGDFHTKSNEFKAFLTDNSIKPVSNRIAIDLGAGHGIQSIPLAEMGFQVMAVDFNQQLLDELKVNAKDLNITTIYDDIKKVETFANHPELIICCGDTLAHLDSQAEVNAFISNMVKALDKNGKLILSFRDYSNALTGVDRIIPVKSDESRILTCILDYEKEFVHVTDLLHEKTNDVWQQKVSTYKKVRVIPSEVVEQLEANGMRIVFNQPINRMTTLIACKE